MYQAEEAAEAAALADEADMPLEQLLARYGYVMGNDADEDSNGPSDMDVDGGKADQPAQASSKEPSDTAGAKAMAPPGAKAVTDAGEASPGTLESYAYCCTSCRRKRPQRINQNCYPMG